MDTAATVLAGWSTVGRESQKPPTTALVAMATANTTTTAVRRRRLGESLLKSEFFAGVVDALDECWVEGDGAAADAVGLEL